MRWRENVRYLLLRIVRKRTTKSWNQSDLDKSLKDKRQPQTLHAVSYTHLVRTAHPSALVLSGDLSQNGEKANHEALAEKLERVQAAGIPVLVSYTHLFVDSLGDSSVVLGIRGWVETSDYWQTRWDLLELSLIHI